MSTKAELLLGDLTARLVELGKATARDAWVEHAGARASIPSYPELGAWRRLGLELRLLEHDRVLDALERRVFVDAYRRELERRRRGHQSRRGRAPSRTTKGGDRG